jgi:hypothetical protein
MKEMKEIMATPAAEDLKTTYGSVRASLMRLQEQVARVSEHYPQSLYPSNGTFLEILVRDLGKVALLPSRQRPA